ncbi:sensor histidine kinase [Fulvivirga sp. M361]|uniref:sensor histidine kinase n=1 Tax=Fulvivirga sp. M361 TaxID=2594266 RepID=UPI001628EFB2|nr:sensor histidine kinase [Fulvivirga sp. M361]
MAGIYRKYGLRILVSIFIYLFFRITSGTWDTSTPQNDTVWPIIILYAIVVVLTLWEVCDRVIGYFSKHYPNELTKKRRLAIIFFTATLATFPLVTLFIYFENYYLKVWLSCIEDPGRVILADITQGYVVTWLVISIEILKLYYISMRDMEMDKTRIQKELLTTQYESLKNQVNPHFLFNNFSVLTALIHKDADLASDFVTQLSKLYRYILDHKQQEMVSLSEELEFLDSYLFLMKIRHEDNIIVERNIDLNLETFSVPPLSLQMLIENAVKHNNFTREKPLLIKIYNEKDQFIVVQNVLNPKNAAGVSTRVGLENIRNRYDLKSDKKVIVYQSDDYFKVKLPVIPSLSLS